MVRTAAKSIFLASVFGILTLNHLTLGYCHCFETIFFTDCRCCESDHHHHDHDEEHHDCCHSGHDDRCPCNEGEDCSTWFTFDLQEFPGQADAELTAPVFSPEPAVIHRQAVPVPNLQGSLHARWYDTTGPPWDPIPIRLRFSVFLI